MATDHEETSSATPSAFYFPQALIEAADAEEAVETYLDHWSVMEPPTAKELTAPDMRAVSRKLYDALERYLMCLLENQLPEDLVEAIYEMEAALADGNSE